MKMKKDKWHKSMKFWRVFFYFLGAILIILVMGVITNFDNKRVDNFESCVKAGNPVMESYPRQCRHEGKVYVEEISYSEYYWKDDGVLLMQNSESGEYGCFGCGTRLCIDPVPIMKLRNESEERYCSDEFEVIES